MNHERILCIFNQFK
jgi:hypothetical protein